jgi:hypothetical protein
MASTSEVVVTSLILAKCPVLTGKDNYTEWAEIMQSNLITSGYWDIVNGDEAALLRSNLFYTSRNRPIGISSFRQVEVEYNRRVRGNYVHTVMLMDWMKMDIQLYPIHLHPPKIHFHPPNISWIST